MYVYSDSVFLIRSVGAQWQKDSETTVDLKTKSIYDIFNTYVKVYLILTHTSLVGTYYVDLDTLKVEFSSSPMTLEELLVFLDNRTLEYVDTIPTTAIKYAKYGDAIRAKYKINTTIIGMELPDNYPETEKVDLVISRPSIPTDLSLLHSHCLISINGYYHSTDTDGEKSYVYEGGKTMRKSKVNHLGILSFLDVGQLTKISLDPTRILPMDIGDTLKDKIVFSVDADLTNKSYFLVLGGYLIFPSENTFWQNGVNTFALDLNKLPYVERLYESSLYMDLSALELSEQIIGDNVYSMPELLSDDVIKKYMTLSQSFLVIVDIPYLNTESIYLRKSNMPGMFTAYQDPVYPLVVTYGKVAEYWKTFEDGYWSVTVADSFLRNYIISEQPTTDLIGVNDHLNPNKPFFHSRGFLLSIYGHNG